MTTSPPPTARAVLADARAAGIVLTRDDATLNYDAPAGAMTDERRRRIAQCRDELLAVLAGDYLAAALALLLSLGDRDRRAALAERFDERAGIAQHDGGMTRAQAERLAYREIALRIEGEHP